MIESYWQGNVLDLIAPEPEAVRIGGEVLVNTATSGNQTDGKAVLLSNGNFVVVWNDLSQGVGGATGDNSGAAIKLQMFSPDGQKIGSEVLVNTAINGGQFVFVVAASKNGGFMVVWDDASGGVGGNTGDTSGEAVKAQLFTDAGVKVGGEILVNTTTRVDQYVSSIDVLSNGNYVVSWLDDPVPSANVYNASAQIFSSTGTRIGGEIVAQGGIDARVTTIPLADGKFGLVWERTTGASDTYAETIEIRLYDATGTALGLPSTVASVLGVENIGGIAKFPDGSFMLTYYQYVTNNNVGTIWGRRYDANGNASAAFQINTQNNVVGSPATTVLASGGYVVSWTVTGPNSTNDIHAQLYSASGAAIGAEFLVNNDTANSQRLSRIVATSTGGFVVAWVDSSFIGGDTSGLAVKAREFDAAGNPVGDNFLVNTVVFNTQELTDLVVLADGRFAAIWNDNSQTAGGDTSGNAVRLQLFLPTAPVTGTAGNDTLTGTAGVDMISGLGGDDTIDGRGGADSLYGGTGNDTYRADRQDDLVFENANEGTDAVISTSNFYLYANIETLILAAGAGNIFGVGNELANAITGNEGNNTLLAGAGIDVVHGGAGVDIIYGEDGNDQLYGDADNDFLAGGLGDDVMDGGAGGDSVYGEGGNDTLYGGTTFEFDRLVGGDGNDILHGDSGQADYDYLYGNAGDDSFYVDTGDDLTFENAGEGTDTVYANVPGANNGVYLYANIENLVLLGTTTFGVGNALANTMTGNASANYLLGGDGADILNGKAGNDVLFGQGGADRFVFGAGTGGDVIGDFVPGTDRIDLSAFPAFTSFAQVQAHMVENGGNSAIDLGNGDLVVINGVTNAQLHAGDFVLPGGGSSGSEPLDALDAFTGKVDVMASGHGLPIRSFLDGVPPQSLPDSLMQI